MPRGVNFLPKIAQLDNKTSVLFSFCLGGGGVKGGEEAEKVRVYRIYDFTNHVAFLCRWWESSTQ